MSDSQIVYLLDTNILLDMMRNPSGAAAQRFQQVTLNAPNIRLCTSVVVQCELLFGLRRRVNPRWQTHYVKVLESIKVLPLDSACVPIYANLRIALESAGTPIGANDLLIAAHALAVGATLVSADAEFLRVPRLKLENWLAVEEPRQNA